MRCFAVAVFAALISLGQTQDNGLTVNTQQGFVTGTFVIPQVRRFLGIPYAVANRWEAPQLPPARATTFSATNFGHSCIQTLSASNLEYLKIAGLAGQQVQESEDCLSLNIWAPSKNRKQNTAVMMWIYGGSFAFGTSNTTLFDGEALVRDNDDIILVTINYRLNIFGFPGSPQLVNPTTSQNFGALDVRAAIQWLHANIAAFGGDPERITIFGQSAGSTLASAYTFANPTDTIVKGVIEQSGSLAGQPQLLTAFGGGPMKPTSWNTVANVVSCENVSAPEQLACMKAVPFRTLENAVLSTGQSFIPIVDGITVFTDTDARSAAGNVLRVPLLVGNTAQEGDVFVVVTEQAGLGFNIPGLSQALGDAVTQIGFNCPTGTTAGDYVTSGVPVWRYQYDGIDFHGTLFPVSPSVNLCISSHLPRHLHIPELRAFHASEIPIVFGTYNSSPFGPPTGAEISLSSYVQDAWVTFARDPQRGLINFGWPQYNPDTASLVRIGNSANQTGVVFAHGDSFDGVCQLTEATLNLVSQLINLLGGLL